MKHAYSSIEYLTPTLVNKELEPRGQIQCGTQLQMKERGSLRLSKQRLCTLCLDLTRILWHNVLLSLKENLQTTFYNCREGEIGCGQKKTEK